MSRLQAVPRTSIAGFSFRVRSHDSRHRSERSWGILARRFSSGDVVSVARRRRTKKRAASACYRGDPWITLVSDNRRVTRPAICCERNRFNRRTSLAAYSPVNLRTVSRPVPEPTRHGHHPSTAGTPSSRGACASDEPRAKRLWRCTSDGLVLWVMTPEITEGVKLQ
jgi:hypothetical protein